MDCVSELNTGGKFNTESFQFSVGMNGVGTKAVNALSDRFYVRAVRDGEYSDALFEKGVLKEKHRGTCKDAGERNGTLVEFLPDLTIFKKFRFREDHVMRRLKMYAYLNAGLTLDLNGTKVVSDEGLADLIQDEAQFEKVYQPFRFRSKTLEFVFTHTNRFSEEYYSFVNGQHTTEGGTHLSAFKEGLTKALNEYAKKKFDGDDVREGIIGAVAIRIQEPTFEGQAKTKLGSPDSSPRSRRRPRRSSTRTPPRPRSSSRRWRRPRSCAASSTRSRSRRASAARPSACACRSSRTASAT